MSQETDKVKIGGGSESFLAKFAEQVPTPDPVEEEVVDTPEEETPEDTNLQEGEPAEEADTPDEADEVTFTTFFSEEEVIPADDPAPEEVSETTVKDKVKYNLKEYVDTYKDKLSNYFKYSSLDLEGMGNEELIRFKLKNDNPLWSKEDIDEELKETYGIGLKKKQASPDAFADEVDKVNQENELIDNLIRRGERRLKTDVTVAKEALKKLKEELELPEVELDVELTADPSKIIDQYTQQQVQQAEEFKETVWIPNIQEAVSKVGGFKQKMEVEVQKGNKVVSELSYKFTDRQKQELVEYLKDYQAHPSDAKYVIDQSTGQVDFTRFVNDKAKQLFSEDILKAQSKELVAQVLSKYVKEEVVNFQDEPRRQTQSQTQAKNFFQEAFDKGSKHLNRR